MVTKVNEKLTSVAGKILGTGSHPMNEVKCEGRHSEL